MVVEQDIERIRRSVMTTRRSFIKSAAVAGAAASLGTLPGIATAKKVVSGSINPNLRIPAQPGKHTLPTLPYTFRALEPVIDARTVEIHYRKHHAGYVKKLNKAEVLLQDAIAKQDSKQIAALQRAVAFNGGGHMLHNLYWFGMAPYKKQAMKMPSDALMAQIRKDFGNYARFMKYFTAATTSVEGNGWGMLAWHPWYMRLMVFQVLNHQNNLIPGVIPLMVADVWEHAYYLKYKNQRGRYVSGWANLIEWKEISRRFDVARVINP